jgi:dTDP-4-dehydrorhamnose reductase
MLAGIRDILVISTPRDLPQVERNHWANLGSGSWYDFAREIAETAQQLGLLRGEPEIRSVTTGQYGRRANRPAYSALDSTKLAQALEVSPLSWQQALRSDMARWRHMLAPEI